MKYTAVLLSLLVISPTWAAPKINSNDVRYENNYDARQDRRDEYRDDCASLKVGDIKISNDECSSKGKNGNSSVHGDNNPGKGHNKNNKH